MDRLNPALLLSICGLLLGLMWSMGYKNMIKTCQELVSVALKLKKPNSDTMKMKKMLYLCRKIIIDIIYGLAY